ncbi:transcription antitermination factor NusB [Candidatus Falkowbacteria bacterium]|jgi:N utilization substance protein B|nr:transcription antitermination factor NusB [Patescibacteria group bacterium]NCU43147.1 transcription antitermination factor NusB [Candidatus Falkowbacteria bacterium]
MSNRHLARTIALQTLFAWDFNGKKSEDLNFLIKNNFIHFAPNFDDGGFVEELISGTVEHLQEIDSLISRHATEWPLDQITWVDRNVLRLGIYELLYSENIPSRVAINEAIEVAKNFGSDSSGKFINGVLGAIYAELPDEKKRDNKEEFEEKKRQAATDVSVSEANSQSL